MQTGLIQNAHNDLVTDAAYDYYGLRLATAGLDQRLKVWSLDEQSGSWVATHDWKAHDAAVSKIAWAHPEFGSVLASASFDRTVKIWEELLSNTDSNSTGASGSRWVQRAVITEAKGSVRAVEFAPHYFGLKLATIASDNVLRIYECLEAPTLSTWQLSEEVDVLSLTFSAHHTLSHPHTISTTTPTQTHTALDGPTASLVASALQNQQHGQGHGGAGSRPGVGSREADGGWCLAWCRDRYWGEVVAAGAGVTGIVKIIQLSPSHRPSTLFTLDPSPQPQPAPAAPPSDPSSEPHQQLASVTTVAWAPSCGRSYHLVATGSRDGHVRIWKLKPPPYDEEGDNGEGEGWSGVQVADFDHHKGAVGRVEWNVTGTVLSSAGNDGRVRLWKATQGNVWRAAGHISVEQAEEGHKEGDVDMDES